MKRLSRDVFVERTQQLLLQHGSVDLSLSSVLTACSANKGSLYHFFPKGKDELLVAAMKKQSEYAISSNRQFLASSSSTGEAIYRLITSFTKLLDGPKCPPILPFSAAGALADEVSDELRAICVDTLTKLENLYAGSLRRDGVRPRVARSLASTIVSTIEGALLQSRARRTVTPLKHAALNLRALIQAHAAS